MARDVTRASRIGVVAPRSSDGVGLLEDREPDAGPALQHRPGRDATEAGTDHDDIEHITTHRLTNHSIPWIARHPR